jgi:predicted RNase H-like nuclease
MDDQGRLDALDEHVRRALHDGRLELTLVFHPQPSGARSGRIVLRDAAGLTVADLALESAEELSMVLSRLVVLGFRADTPAAADSGAPARSRSARIETDVVVAGVDGYRKGWVAVSVDPSGDVEVSTHASFVEVLALRAQVIAVDIPIDPTGQGARRADSGARAFVGGRASSVFATPPRAALEAATFAEANEIARTITGKGLSQQAFGLRQKLLEVHEHAAGDERIVEMHPEVSFCELAGAPLGESKHTAEGLARRRALLSGVGIELPKAVHGVPEVDLLDAAVGAWTAARYGRGNARAFPPEHTDRLGAIWR